MKKNFENKKSSSLKAFSLIELSIVILIIGILIAGITQSSRLVGEFRLSSARSLTQSSPVASIKGLVLWYDTISEKSFDENEQNNSSAVTNWYDLNPLSTIKINASSSGTGRPTYTTNCINSLPCLSFDGTDDYMDTASLGVNSTTVSYFIVVNPVVIASGTAAISLIMTNGNYSSTNNSVHFQIWQKGATNPGRLEFTPANSSSTTFSNSALTENKVYILEAIDSGSAISLYDNGKSIGSSSPSTGLKSLNILNIGSYNSGSSRDRFLNGRIGEIIIFDRNLKNEERASVEAYLSKKWGIK